MFSRGAETLTDSHPVIDALFATLARQASASSPVPTLSGLG